MSKDYYKVLGVEKNASAEEIKKAFKKLAMTHHPDRQGGNEAKFKEINEAYQVLSDQNKRERYNQFGSDFEQQGGFGGGASWDDFMRAARGGQGGANGFNFGGVDLGDLFGGMFGFGDGQGGQGRSQQGRDVQVDVELDFKEAAFGIEKDISLHKQAACDVCGGGAAKESGYFERLKEISSALQEKGKIFFRGAVPNEQTPAIFNAHLVSVNLTPKGNYDKTVLEGMACGTLSLVSSPAFNDIIPPEFRFKENDSRDLAQKIKSVFSLSESEAAKYGVAGRRAVEAKESLILLSKNMINHC